MQTWVQWQSEVVAALREELQEIQEITHVALDDVDWVAWYGLYLEGRSPKTAVRRALELDP
jgi:hypothetical protein